MSALRLLADLVKWRVAGTATLSGLAVCLLASGRPEALAPLGLGIFLLCCGACGLNQYQERERDRLLRRTAGRPLPAGRVTPGQALLASVCLLAGGLPWLYRASGPAGAALAVLAVVWYNGLYTPLKRLTAFAAVPGALAGVVPPVLGWLAAGRCWRDPRLLALGFVFYLWQVPHFWLLVPGDAADLGRARLPNLCALFGQARLARLTSVWMSAAAGSVLLLPLFGATGSFWTLLLLAGAAAWLAGKALDLLRAEEPACFRAAFSQLTVFMIAVTALIACDPFLPRP